MTMKVIKEVSKEDLKKFLYNIDLKDDNLYKEINSKDAINIFQFTGNTCKGILNRVKPVNFNECVAINALSRPGTSSFTGDYVDRKNGAPTPYPKKMNEILKETSGVILYQEQVMSIFNILGGFTLEETNYVRGLLKKLGKKEKKQSDLDAWKECIKKFKMGCAKNGISAREAEFIADEVQKMSSYQFNKSHAVAYTYTAIMTCYLSYYFRKYYDTASLAYEIEKDNSLEEQIKKVRNQGFELLQPDINKSDMDLIPVGDNKILFGFKDIKGIGDSAIKKIIDNRPYTNFIDFVLRSGVSSLIVKKLIMAGCFDTFDKNRKKLLVGYEKYLEQKKTTKIKEKLQKLLEDIFNDLDIGKIITEKQDLMNYQKECFGMNVFISKFSDKIIRAVDEMSRRGLAYKNFDDIEEGKNLSVPVYINSIRRLTDKNRNKMCFINIEDMSGAIRSVPIFANYYKALEDELMEENIYLMNFYKYDDQIMFGRSDRRNPQDGAIKRMARILYDKT